MPGFLEGLWQNGLLACEKRDVFDWSWLSMDGCIIKSPLAGSTKQVATRLSGASRGKAQPDDRCERTSALAGSCWGKYPRHKIG